jgi:hypothetical protein
MALRKMGIRISQMLEQQRLALRSASLRRRSVTHTEQQPGIGMEVQLDCNKGAQRFQEGPF